MRVVDLDREMEDVIPTGTTRDSRFLFARMTEATLALAEAGPGRAVLDVASGFGQDALAMAARGARVIGVEPSQRMSAWARLRSAEAPAPLPLWVRGWADGLPFRSESFDAVICKGAIDHFDRPQEAIAEVARVTRADGIVVLAIANFESLSFRVSRLLDALQEHWLSRPLPRGRRHHDVPADHFTRYDLALMRAQASKALRLGRVSGVSLGWGLPRWAWLLERVPHAVAQALLRSLDGWARRVPEWADVAVLAGRPRRRSAP